MPNTAFQAADPGFSERVAQSFSLQGAMHTLGARLAQVRPGAVDIVFDWAQALSQQHGFVHAGMLTAALDSACGYAAFSLMPTDAAVLTIEFKTNLLAPARGKSFRAEGRVLKPGRTITVCEGRAFALADGGEKLVATMSCTLMCVQGRPGISG